LKPDVLPFRRRSEMVRPCPRSKAQGTLPCENDQAKPDHISRLARSTNLSKILAGLPPRRALLDRGPSCYAGVSSNLLRLPFSAFDRVCRRFCANFLNLSNFHLRVKLNLFLRLGPLKLVVGGGSSIANFDRQTRESPFRKYRTAQNIKERPAIYA
jgi:hypothetical protein